MVHFGLFVAARVTTIAAVGPCCVVIGTLSADVVCSSLATPRPANFAVVCACRQATTVVRCCSTAVTAADTAAATAISIIFTITTDSLEGAPLFVVSTTSGIVRSLLAAVSPSAPVRAGVSSQVGTCCGGSFFAACCASKEEPGAFASS